MIKPGEYFVPVTGEVDDGHKYVEQAVNNGAKGTIEKDELYERVKSKLAKSKIKIVGITGSNGKTTAAYLAHQLLSQKYNAVLGKHNTKLGLATDFINKVGKDTEIFVAEIGMDHLGEIRETVELFPLDVAVILTINGTHLEKLRSIENIVKAKFEIVEGLKDKDSVLILNKDNKLTTDFVKNNVRMFGDIKVILFSESSPANLSNLKLPGKHNKLNTLSVIAVAKILGMTSEEIDEGLSRLNLPIGRLNVIEGINKSTLIDDTYNANPESSAYALEVLSDYYREYSGNRKIAILGDMLELGENEIPAHIAVAKKVDEMGVDILVTVGELANIIFERAHTKEKYKIKKPEDFPQLLDELKIYHDIILIKGSQGIRTEKITKTLMAGKSKASELLVRQDGRWK